MAAVTDPSPKPSSAIFTKATESASFIRSKLPSELQSPRVAIVCGSGLGGIAGTINPDVKVEINYVDIPNFPKTTGKSRSGPGASTRPVAPSFTGKTDS